MRILYDFLDGPRGCTYLPEQQALMQYVLTFDLKADEYEDLMSQNFRKFGHLLFRPNCKACSACQPLRVPLNTFRLDRSMKRCVANNQDLRFEVGSAKNSDDQLELFNSYHQVQVEAKDWQQERIDSAEYSNQFLESSILIEEIRLYLIDKLLGVILFEELGQGISLIYHYYDPTLKKRGLGTFLILKAIELAKHREKEFAYLGYYVSGSKSMEYKEKFKPNQVLKEGIWR